MGISIVEFHQVFENRPRWVPYKKDRTTTYLIVECTNRHRPIVAAVIYDETAPRSSSHYVAQVAEDHKIK
ncbi:hypothetical protein MLPF_1030 [Mycobacterium lepromatosis]|nr:hypothetical protein MLPF_1030 [Mycobacterium lepromatosis]